MAIEFVTFTISQMSWSDMVGDVKRGTNISGGSHTDGIRIYALVKYISRVWLILNACVLIVSTTPVG